MKRLFSVLAMATLLAACPQRDDPEPTPAATAATASPTPSASPTSSGARAVADETDDFLFEYSYPIEAGRISELASLLDVSLAEAR